MEEKSDTTVWKECFTKSHIMPNDLVKESIEQDENIDNMSVLVNSLFSDTEMSPKLINECENAIKCHNYFSNNDMFQNKNDDIINFEEYKRINFIDCKYQENEKPFITDLKCDFVFEINGIGSKKSYLDCIITIKQLNKDNKIKSLIKKIFKIDNDLSHFVVFKLNVPFDKMNSAINELASSDSMTREGLITKAMLKTLNKHDFINALKNNIKNKD